MSTEFATLLRIRASDLLDGRLERFGVCEDVNDETSDTAKRLTAGHNFLWVYIDVRHSSSSELIERASHHVETFHYARDMLARDQYRDRLA